MLGRLLAYYTIFTCIFSFVSTIIVSNSANSNTPLCFLNAFNSLLAFILLNIMFRMNFWIVLTSALFLAHSVLSILFAVDHNRENNLRLWYFFVSLVLFGVVAVSTLSFVYEPKWWNPRHPALKCYKCNSLTSTTILERDPTTDDLVPRDLTDKEKEDQKQFLEKSDCGLSLKLWKCRKTNSTTSECTNIVERHNECKKNPTPDCFLEEVKLDKTD